MTNSLHSWVLCPLTAVHKILSPCAQPPLPYLPSYVKGASKDYAESCHVQQGELGCIASHGAGLSGARTLQVSPPVPTAAVPTVPSMAPRLGSTPALH